MVELQRGCRKKQIAGNGTVDELRAPAVAAKTGRARVVAPHVRE